MNKYWSQFWSNIRRIGVNQCPFDAKIVDFRKWPKSSRYNRADYYGFRIEVAAASLFIRRNVDFIKSESPDYIVNRPVGETIFVECGSIHLSKSKSRNVGYKISSAIRSKIKMPYMNLRTVLFLDITNIIHHTLVSENYMKQAEIESLAKAQMIGQQIGGTCLFFYMLDKEKDYFSYNSIRVDNENPDPVLLDFLNEQFPDSGQFISNYTVPSAG